MNTSRAQAKSWILVAIGIAAGSAVLQTVESGDVPKLSIAFGALFAAILLTLLAEIEPGLAAGIAAIVAIGALLNKGSLFVKLTNTFVPEKGLV